MSGTIRLWALAMLVVLAAAGCEQAGGSGGQGLEGTAITFSINVDDSERAAIQELLGTFQRRTRAKVNLEQLSRFRKPLGPKVSLVTDTTDGLVERLAEDVRTGAPTVHLFAQDNVALGSLVANHLVRDLREIDVPDQAIDALAPEPSASGDRYFLPFRPNVRLAYGRTEDFDKAGVRPPESEDALLSTARALKGSGPPRVTMSLAPGNPRAVTLCELIRTHGGNPLVLNDAGSVEAFTFLQRFSREGLLAPQSFQAKFDTEVENLIDRTASLAENWPFTSAQLDKDGQLQDFVVYPGWNGPEQVRVIGGDVLGIPVGVKGKQLQAAANLAQFLMSQESQELLALRNSWPSFRNDVDLSSLPEAKQVTFSAIARALENGWYRPSVSYWPTVSDEINKAVDAVIYGHRPIQEVLDEAHGRIDEAAARPRARP